MFKCPLTFGSGVVVSGCRGLPIALLCLAMIMPLGCGKQDKAYLTEQINDLKRQLISAQSKLGILEAEGLQQHADEMQLLREQLAQQQQELESVTRKLVEAKIERDQLKQELSAVRKQRRGYGY